MHTVTTLEAFRTTTEDDIEAAFAELDTDPESSHPIIMEIERLVNAYAAMMEQKCQQGGSLPEDALLHEPTIPIEQAAFEVFTEALHDSMLEMDDDDA